MYSNTADCHNLLVSNEVDYLFVIIILELSKCMIPISYDYHESSDVPSVLLNRLSGA